MNMQNGHIDTTLRALKEIIAYMGYCKIKLKRLIRDENSFAVRIENGRY